VRPEPQFGQVSLVILPVTIESDLSVSGPGYPRERTGFCANQARHRMG
jgi:hypothetical protein